MSVETLTYVASEMVDFTAILVAVAGIGAASLTTLVSLGRGLEKGRFVKDAAYGGLSLAMIGVAVSMTGAIIVEGHAKPAELVEYIEKVAATLTYQDAFELLQGREVVEDGRLYEAVQVDGTEIYTLTITDLETAE